MKKQTEKSGFVLLSLIFVGFPLYFYTTGNFPRRSLLKETLSIVIILAFCLMLAQFYLTRTNSLILHGYLGKSIIKLHKNIGYVLVSVLLVHPLLIVLPRYFESGIDGREAFMVIVTSFDSPGILLGISAWWLLLILGVTSLIRKYLPFSYNTWRLLHRVLAVLFIVSASWHAINLGRHTTLPLSTYFVIAALGGVAPLIKIYLQRF